ncbi:MAG: type 4a pilus biogenesis protein PilO [Mariprofundaceae bacterium]
MNLDALNLDVLRPILPIPAWQKLIALAAVFVLIIVSYLYLGWMPLQESIENQQRQVEMQKIQLKKNQALAKDLPRKRAEFAKLEKQLKAALNMLPKKSQIPDLLENVSWAGKDSGLEFSIFTPKGEVVKQIYAEVPVNISVLGSYRQLLTFLKRVGEMPRIVAIKDLTLTQGKAGGDLAVKGSVVTYRFVEASTAKKPGKKR